MIKFKDFRKTFKVKIYDDAGRPMMILKDSSPKKLKKKFNSIFDKLL